MNSFWTSKMLRKRKQWSSFLSRDSLNLLKNEMAKAMRLHGCDRSQSGTSGSARQWVSQIDLVSYNLVNRSLQTNWSWLSQELGKQQQVLYWRVNPDEIWVNMYLLSETSSAYPILSSFSSSKIKCESISNRRVKAIKFKIDLQDGIKSK